MSKKAIVVHSGGMDSSICLKLAINRFGQEEVLSLTFDYGQRHKSEIDAAKTIAHAFQVDHLLIEIPYLATLTKNSLTDHSLPIEKSLVVGRNGLMARLAAIYGNGLGVSTLYMGVMENESYRDCSRKYMDLMETILRIDLDDPLFTIETPLVHMTKLETLQLARKLGILTLLYQESVTCYEGLKGSGCRRCPSCLLRNEAFSQIDADILL